MTDVRSSAETFRRIGVRYAVENSVNFGFSTVKDSLGQRHPTTARRTVEA